MTADDSNKENPAEDRFQILSLDGGGIKGLFSAAVLAAIEEDLEINIVDHFDLIAGTSTGGIIAIGIGLGMKPREIVEFYLREGPKIFPRWLGAKWFQQWAYRKFSAEPLIKALQSCFKGKQFGDSKKRLVIPSYNLGADDVYIFRTPHAERLRRDYKVPAWKVALATSSAPTFFPCTRKVDNARLIDGGVWANNPTMVAIIEAFGTLNVPLSSLWAFSIGTSDAITKRGKRLNTGGIVAWGLGRDRVERLDPKVAADEFSLDGIHKVDDLIGNAAHYSRAFMPTFQQKFAKHRAAPYVPMFT